MTDRQQQQLVSAFKSGNMHLVEQLLTSIRPVVVSSLRTQFKSLTFAGEVAMVSLLHLAAYWGWKDIAVCLVAVHNCSPMWKDEEGDTSLHYAAYNGHLEVVKYFTAELHCDPMVRSNNSTTPLHIASVAGHLNIVRYLISEAHCNPLCEDNHGDTPLHDACRNGHLNMAQYLISEAHCDPSCEDIMGWTPLDWAFRQNHIHIVQYLQSSSTLSESQYTHVHKLFNVTVVLYTGAADLKSDVQTDIVEQKEEDHIYPPTVGAGSGDLSSILSESQYTHVHKLTGLLLNAGIEDLAEIIMELKNLNNWLPLGLQLGLRYETLKRIEKEQHGLINECKTEMLVAWLKRNDNVGVPCCAILKAALKKIDENQLASEINNL